MKISIIIPNWNGKKLLEKNLPRVLAAAEKGKAELIVVDDGSTDGSVQYLQKLKSKDLMIRIIRLSQNYGFAYAVNLGVIKAKGEIVVLLNTDVIPEKDFLKPLEKDFTDPKVFAVSLCEPQFGWAWGEFKDGYLSHKPKKGTNQPHISLWASGGSGAFRKKTWQDLGGFDSLYHPFYWEDVDLCWRAWKRGYQILWEPKAIVHHQHESTVSRLSPSYVDLIKQRNELLFIWKNITTPKLILAHMFWLGKRLLTKLGYGKPFLMALAKLPLVLPRRLKEIREKEVSDEKIFAQFK